MRVKLTLNLRRRAKAKVTPTCKLFLTLLHKQLILKLDIIFYIISKNYKDSMITSVTVLQYQRHTISYDHNHFPLHFTKFLLLAASSINQ